MSSNTGLSPADAMSAPSRRSSGRRHRPIRPRPPGAAPPPGAKADLLADYEHGHPQRSNSEGSHIEEGFDVLDGTEGERRYRCQQCGNTYSNRANLNVHLNVHSNSKCFQCDKCFKSFSRRSSLYNHKKTHSINDVFKCSICDVNFESCEALVNHEPSHLDKNGHTNYEAQCFVCASILSTKFGLKLHIMQRHPEIVQGNTEKTHSCVKCGKKYTNETLLKAHMKTHSAAKVHACASCDYSATTRVGLQQHVDRIHLKLRKFECSLCGKLFVSQPDRKLHMLRHYKIKPVQCGLCPMRFYSTRELRKHKFAHSGQKPHRCDDCDVAFAYVESLRRHVSTHLSHPVSCDRCLRQFMCKKSLAKHLRSHPPNNNVFKCSDCDKSYKNFKCLDTHQAKLRHKETVYCCHECGLEFQSIDQFNSHDRDGHNITIFICRFCSVSFQCKSKLIDHMRLGHGICDKTDTQSRSSANGISMKLEKISSPLKCDEVGDDFLGELDFVKLEKKNAVGVPNATDTLYHECNPNEGVEVTTTLDTLVDNYSPIEGVEVTIASDALMDVFRCSDCDKLFASERDCAEHARYRHSTASYENSTFGVATSIQIVADGAIEHLSCSLADLVEIDLSSVPMLL